MLTRYEINLGENNELEVNAQRVAKRSTQRMRSIDVLAFVVASNIKHSSLKPKVN